jgi:lysophospholipase L1-like esterase
VTGTEWQNYPALSGTPAAADTLLLLHLADTSASSAGTVHQVDAGSFQILLSPSGDTTGATDASAVAAALGSYGNVVLQAGSWYLSGLDITQNGVTLQGSGGATVINVPASGTGITVSNVSQLQLSGMAFSLGSGSLGIQVNGAANSNFSDLWFTGSAAAGAVSINGDDNTEQDWTNCVASDVGGTAFKYTRTTTTDTGGMYFIQCRAVNPPSGAAGGWSFASTAGSATPANIWMYQCVADAYLATGITVSNIRSFRAVELWSTLGTGAASGHYPLHITGPTGNMAFIGGYLYQSYSAGYCAMIDGSASGIHLGGGLTFDGAASGGYALGLSAATSVGVEDIYYYSTNLTAAPSVIANVLTAPRSPVTYMASSGTAFSPLPAASDGHSPAPVVTFNGSSTQQGDWQEIASISLTAQYYSGAVALAVQGNGGPERPSSATVRFAVKQDAALGSAPVVVLTADNCQTIAAANFWAVVTSNTSSLTTVALYLQAPADYESYDIRELASGTGGGTIAYASGGATWLTSLPSGTQQYAVPSPGTAQAADAAMQQWLAALAGRHYAAASITCVGTSITAGTYLSKWEYSWPVILQGLLNARYPSNGLATHGRGILIPVLQGTGITPDYVTITGGTSTTVFDYGFDGATYTVTGLTVTYSLVGTSCFVIYTQQSGGGDLIYAVDGGSPVSTSTAGGTTQSGQVIGPVTLGATAGTSHTLVITTSGGPVYLDGVTEYNGDEGAGLQVYNCGCSGATTPGWQATDLRSIATTYSPLYVVELGVNDWGAITPAAFQSDLAGLLGDILTACSDEGAPAPAFLLLICYLQDYTTTDVWQQYVTAMYAVAEATASTMVLDLTQLMPPAQSGGGPYGLYYTDGQHPSEIGHSMIAELVARFLSPA